MLFTTQVVWASTNQPTHTAEIEVSTDNEWLSIDLIRPAKRTTLTVYLTNERKAILKDVRQVAVEIVDHFGLSLAKVVSIRRSLMKIVDGLP